MSQLPYVKRLQVKDEILERKRKLKEIAQDFNLHINTVAKYARIIRKGEDILEARHMGGFRWQRLDREQETYLVNLCEKHSNETCNFIYEKQKNKYL